MGQEYVIHSEFWVPACAGTTVCLLGEGLGGGAGALSDQTFAAAFGLYAQYPGRGPIFG